MACKQVSNHKQYLHLSDKHKHIVNPLFIDSHQMDAQTYNLNKHDERPEQERLYKGCDQDQHEHYEPQSKVMSKVEIPINLPLHAQPLHKSEQFWLLLLVLDLPDSSSHKPNNSE